MRFLATLAFLLLAASVHAITYVAEEVPGDVVIDTRPLSECKTLSLPMARCLPLTDMLGPMRQLPSERDLLWLFGTAGLDGGESVLVTGDSATARDFVAGLLYLSGQRQVHILAQPLTHRLSARFQGGPGQERGMLRTAVFTAPMRDHLWLVNRSEARSAGAAAIHGKDAYTAIIRFSRHIASGGQAMPVGWNSSFGGSVQ